MQSHEVLRQAIDPVGVKMIAREIGVSAALVYKWCQPFDPDDPDSGGARNPLDRLLAVLRKTEDLGPVTWLCRQMNGYFVGNPEAVGDNLDTRLLTETQQLVQEFSDLLRTVTQAVENDGLIEPAEAERIRAAWDSLKSSCESFTVACERGLFRRPRQGG